MIEIYCGMSDDNIWLWQVIVDAVADLQGGWEEITALNVAKKVLDHGNLSGSTSFDELLEECEDYLQFQYNNFFAELDFAPDDLKGLTESEKDNLFNTITAKSKLYKAHAAELDTYVMSMFRDSAVSPE